MIFSPSDSGLPPGSELFEFPKEAGGLQIHGAGDDVVRDRRHPRRHAGRVRALSLLKVSTTTGTASPARAGSAARTRGPAFKAVDAARTLDAKPTPSGGYTTKFPRCHPMCSLTTPSWSTAVTRPTSGQACASPPRSRVLEHGVKLETALTMRHSTHLTSASRICASMRVLTARRGRESRRRNERRATTRVSRAPGIHQRR
jgi:hypothetical protein